MPGFFFLYPMKINRKTLYAVLVTGTLAFFAVILIFSKKKVNPQGAYIEPRGTYALSAEWLNSKAAIEGLVAKIEANPEDYKSMLMLAQAYVQESRNTGDHAFYDKAALDLTDKIIAKEPRNFEAHCCKATVLLSQHHFAEALGVASKAKEINPNSAFIYGILCDANVELGNYDEAVNMADKMNSLRPDIRSYSRISYLREIYGDLPGAISAMKLAVASGYPGLEQTEWARVFLGHLYENMGSLDSAEQQYSIALQERPDYPFALAGKGRIAKARGKYPEAITYYEKADKMILEYSFSDELTDLYLLQNQKSKSEETAEKVIELLAPPSDLESQSGHGHYADRELAYAYIKSGDLDKALEHAQIEYNRRPQNIDVCETVAWVRYKRGEYAEANKLMATALRTGSQNPVLLCRAGLIKIKTGDAAGGKTLVQKAVSLNPFMDPLLKKEAQPYLSAQ